MKKFLLKSWLTMLCLLVGVGTSWAETVTVTLKDGGSSSDGTSKIANSGATIDAKKYTVSATDFVNSVVAGNAYVFQAQSDCGWKFGNSNNAGKITINLKESVEIASVKVTAKNASSKVADLKIGGGTAQALTADFADYTQNYTSGNSTNSIVIETALHTSGDRRAYITSIVITTADGGSGDNTPVSLSVPSNLATSNVTTTGATLSWGAVSNASSYTVKIGETEYTGVNTNSYSATGLTAGTQYTWTVKAVGDGTNYATSAYAANATFTTEAEQGGEDGGNEETPEEQTVAFVLEYGGKMLAAGVNVASSKAPAIEVSVRDGKVYVNSAEDAEKIAWLLTESSTEGKYLIQPKNVTGKYLSAASSSANVSLATSKCLWTGKGDGTYWILKDDTQEYYRTLTYQEGSTKAFKAYTSSNIGTTNYAARAAVAMPIVVAPVPAYSEVKALNVTADNGKERYFTTFSSDKVTFFPEYDEEMTSATSIKTAMVDDTEFILEKIAKGTATIGGEDVEGFFVPANTGVLVQVEYDDKVEKNVPYYEVSNKTVNALDGNDLHAGNGEMLPAGKVWYKLAWADASHAPSTLGFYYGAADGVPFVSTKGKAYLGLTQEQAAKKISFSLVDDEATSIKTVDTVNGTSAVYNLAGQRVAPNTKGIVIVNGKKFINK